ncbi:MAG: hypothetical protein OEM52_08145 [bacterium]|nr:hypothetical protein [bacterium]
MPRLQQLSLFELTKPESEKESVPSALFQSRQEPESLPAPPPPSRSQRKLERLRFEELADWLHRELATKITRELIVKPLHGRTRFVSMKTEGKVMMLRLHRRFIDAPDPVREALLTWLKGPRRKAPKLVQQFIHELSTLAATEQRRLPLRSDLPTYGKHYDLTAKFQEVNNRFFSGACRVAIGWGKQVRKHAKSRNLGSYSAAYHRIAIHPLLDDPKIPEFVVKFVIFHELLHALQSPSIRIYHDNEFREAERSHPDYERVKQWEKEYFGRIRC